MIVFLCFDARSANAPTRSSRSSSMIRIASRSWSAVALSWMSLLVAPRCTYLPASPAHASVRARTTAMRSCRVSRSSSSSRFTRDEPDFGLRAGEGRLDVQKALKARLLLEDPLHLRATVAEVDGTEEGHASLRRQRSPAVKELWALPRSRAEE